MSNPSPPPEHTAATTPVSHAQADSTAVAGSGLVADQVPVLPTAPALPATAPSQPDAAAATPQGAQSTQTAALPAPLDGDPNKKSRPAVLQRHTGPSLLTQALASARGIPSAAPQTDHSQRPPPHPYDSQSTHPRQDLNIRQNPDTIASPNDDGSQASTADGSLTPRSSSRSVAMASSATLTTTGPTPTLAGDILAPSATLTLRSSDYRADERLQASQRGLHGPLNAQYTLPQGRESEHRPFELPIRTGPFSNNILDHDTTASPTVLERSATQPALNSPDTTRDPRQPARPRKMEHRVSMGPEKAWSIGSGDLNKHQDGQVEKSITEVLSGLEPNRGSRKASHSLRFFKEGLPEDKIKRRETRLTPSREKLSPTAEAPTDTEKFGPDEGAQYAQDAFPSPRSIEDKYAEQVSTDDKSVKSPPASVDVRSSQDYFGDAGREQRSDIAAFAEDSDPSTHGNAEVSKPLVSVEARSVDQEREGRRTSEATKSDEHTEDGDESGEEKISSAVFLPHQGPEESSELASAGPGSIPRPKAVIGTHPRNEDFHPWLVKADEPETDVTSPEEENFEGVPHPTQEVRRNHIKETPYHTGYDAPVVAELDAAEVSNQSMSRPLSQQYDDHVHDHQHRQPLEAIELIPYRHQVGGHTTLWRFSKRAVCKQLNNRENEFYERIERFHRDLLAFLPRYIGVLNVTFHKQPRRRSTVRKDDNASHERKQIDQDALRQVLTTNGTSAHETVGRLGDTHRETPVHTRVISQSLQSAPNQVPTVTFVDNQHILPRNLLQPTPGSPRGSPKATIQRREMPIEIPPEKHALLARPSLEERHANSWGATTVNKKLRNEVFNDAFLKQPIAIQRHQHKANRRAIPRKTLQQILRQSNSDPNLVSSPMRIGDDHSPSGDAKHESTSDTAEEPQRMSIDLPRQPRHGANDGDEPRDVTGTSAPEPDTLSEQPPSQRKKRRYSGTVLRRKPKDVSDSRGDLHVFEEPDDAGYKGDNEGGKASGVENGFANEDLSRTPTAGHQGHDGESGMELSNYASTVTSRATSPTAEFRRIPRPINPKEAQTQRDSRREYFLLLEDLTAGMKRPCIMDLKMGTRQYGVDANPKKQKSQQRKCAETTSRELGVRVCGLQVWDVPTQSYVFKDKYYGRDIKAGQEFQDALTRFLYDGADPSSILRHIPTVLNKLSQLEVIISRLGGYRFYAASLLMFYDGDQSDDGNDTAVEDSTTDFATDTEDYRDQRKRRNKREIDFKMADFANSVMAGDLTGGKACPPQHPNKPDHGFVRGLRSLRRYFLKIQRDTRMEMDLAIPFRENGSDVDLRSVDDDSAVSE